MVDHIRLTVSTAVPVLAVIVGILLGAWLTSHRDRAARKLAFIERQLQLLYSPLVGIRTEISMLSDLRHKISLSAERQWRKQCEEARERGGAALLEDLTKKKGNQFDAIIHYNNRQLTESLLPSYRRMIEILRDNYYLAEPETREHFQSILEYVEIWDRWLGESLPREVLADLKHGEQGLTLFFQDLQKQHDGLRLRLQRGEP